MAARAELSEVLHGLASNVYFQPPATIQMSYPCIVYHRKPPQIEHADNRPYRKDTLWQITVIDRSPDSAIAEAVEELPGIHCDANFTQDNLHHYVYSLNY